MTKFLKAILSITLFEFFDLFILEFAAVGITTLFNEVPLSLFVFK